MELSSRARAAPPPWGQQWFQEAYLRLASCLSKSVEWIAGCNRTSYYLTPAGRIQVVPAFPTMSTMCLRLGHTSQRSKVYPNAFAEYSLTRQLEGLRVAWELHWGVCTVLPSGHHAADDFSRFFFSGLPATEDSKLFAFLHGLYSHSRAQQWQLQMRAYRVKYNDEKGTLSGMVDLDLGSRKREAYNYCFCLPWI
jgi:hypothetical protein